MTSATGAPTGQDPSTHGVLAGVKVVEFSQNAAVPTCARLLAGMGADVIKVEPVAGDAMRFQARLADNEGRAFATINPGKRGIGLDYGAAGASEVVDRLLQWADISLVGLKLSDVEPFGLDWEHARSVNPRLVHLVFTAFGREGPDAEQGGYDVLVQGISGLGWSMNRVLDGVPVPTRPAFIDFSSGATAAAAVLAALRHRDLTGEGQRVDASLLGSAVALGTPMLSGFEQDAEDMDVLLDDIGLLRESGADFETQRDVYESRLSLGAAFFRLYFRHYLTADGIISVAGMSPALIAKFHHVTGLPRLPLDSDPNSAEFSELIKSAEQLFLTQTTAEWTAILRDAGYPCTRYNMSQETRRDPQVLANDYMVDLEHPEFGGYTTTGMPFSFSGTPSGVSNPSPRLGEHTAAVLAELGFTPEAIATLASDNAVTIMEPAPEEG